MALLSRTVPLLLVVGSAGCEIPSTPLTYSEASYSVHAVLKEGDTEARVLVTRFDPRTGGSVPTGGSEVTLAGPADTIRLLSALPGVRCTESPQPEVSAGCHSAILPRPFAAGERWRLLVRLPDGELATGEARVLSRPGLLAPVRDARIEVQNRGQLRLPEPVGSVDFHLTPDPARGDWAVRTTTLAVFAADSVLEGATCDPLLRFSTGPTEHGHFPLPFGDELKWGLASVTCARAGSVIAWDSIRARIEVTAFDTVYARYSRDVQFDAAARRPSARAGIQGVFGLFASVAAVTQDVVFLSRP